MLCWQQSRRVECLQGSITNVTTSVKAAERQMRSLHAADAADTAQAAAVSASSGSAKPQAAPAPRALSTNLEAEKVGAPALPPLRRESVVHMPQPKPTEPAALAYTGAPGREAQAAARLATPQHTVACIRRLLERMESSNSGAHGIENPPDVQEHASCEHGQGAEHHTRAGHSRLKKLHDEQAVARRKSTSPVKGGQLQKPGQARHIDAG